MGLLRARTYGLNELAQGCHQIAVEHGWWNGDREFGTLVALLHSEVSEMLELYRRSTVDTSVKDIKGMDEEMADVIIRLLDMAAFYEIDIDSAVGHKMGINMDRPYRHGGKRV